MVDVIVLVECPSNLQGVLNVTTPIGQGHRHGVYGVRFQPYGNLIATASFDYTAKLWDPRSGEDVQTLRGHLEDVIGVDIDDSGFLLATGSDDKTCRVWDLRMGNPIAILQEHTGEVKRVVFSPFSKLLATTSGDTTIRMFDTSTFKCVHILRCVRYPCGCQFLSLLFCVGGRAAAAARSVWS